MAALQEIQRSADLLSEEDRAGLLAYLLATLPAAPLGADDAEVSRREAEMDSGAVKPLTYEEFLSALDRR